MLQLLHFEGITAFRRDGMHIFIYKEKRELHLLDDDKTLLRAPVGLGRVPIGAKKRDGDGKTPEGTYSICLIKTNGKYGRSLGLNYPNLTDANAALNENAIDMDT
jgi:murein L,D-transpeptidase YafK